LLPVYYNIKIILQLHLTFTLLALVECVGLYYTASSDCKWSGCVYRYQLGLIIETRICLALWVSKRSVVTAKVWAKKNAALWRSVTTACECVCGGRVI